MSSGVTMSARAAAELVERLDRAETALAVLRGLVARLPACESGISGCGGVTATKRVRDRWCVCDACARVLPWPDAEPSHDWSAELAAALEILGATKDERPAG